MIWNLQEHLKTKVNESEGREVNVELENEVRAIFRNEISRAYEEAARKNSGQAEPKPEHYDGEPCELPISHSFKDMAKDFTFQHTGFKRSPDHEWILVEGTNPHIEFYAARAADRYTYWILRAVPNPKWEPKPGEWVWDTENQMPCKITDIQKGHFYVRFTAGWTGWRILGNLRPLTLEDVTCEIGGVKVVAFEDEDGNLRMCCGACDYCYYKELDANITMRELLANSGVPILPNEAWKQITRKDA